jgi:hypothetical protein
MAFGKPVLSDGLAQFLVAWANNNNGLTIERVNEIMAAREPEYRKAQRIRDEAGFKSIQTAKRYIAQWKREQADK